MYLQHFGLKFSPFTRQPNPDVFFTQAGRKNILQALHHDLQQNQPTMLLIGSEGAGKTVFCQLIRHRLSRDTYKGIYLNNPVGSFEELLRQICGQLGTPLTVDTEQDVATVLKTLLEEQKEQGRRILLLIDEAERMFLAALERIFRLLNELHDTYQVQTLFTGRPALHVSIKQLGEYCEDVRIASTYALEPLSEKETATYLAYRLKAAGNTRGKSGPVFSEKAVHEITRLGKALPGIIDEIAEVALKNAATAGADTVLLSHVALPQDPAVASGIDDTKTGKKRNGLLFLFFLVFLISLFFIRPSFFANQKEAFLKIVQNFKNTESSIIEPEKNKVPLPFVVQEIETDGTLPTPLAVPQRPDFEKKEGDRGAEKVVVKQEESIEQRPKRNLNKAKFLEVNENNFVEKVSSTFSPEELTQVTQAVSSSKVNRNPLTTAKKLPIIHSASVVELKPSMKKTRPPGFRYSPPKKENKTKTTAPPKQKILVPVASAQGIVILPAAQGVVVRPTSQRVVVRPAVINAAASSNTSTTPVTIHIPSQNSGSQNENSVSYSQNGREVAEGSERLPTTSTISASRVPAVKKPEPKSIQPPKITPPPRAGKANELFARYLRAGSSWTNKAYKDKFTVQLLVLSSDDVMKNIKDMIIRDEYQDYKNTLYILRRNTVPPTLFVCYGVYSSIDEAKNARDAMPLFLRKHHPYALPITDVLAKAKN